MSSTNQPPQKENRNPGIGPANVKWIRIIRHATVSTVYFETNDANYPHGWFVLNGATEGYVTALAMGMANGHGVSYNISNPGVNTCAYGHSDIILTANGTIQPVDADTSGAAYEVCTNILYV